MKPSELLTKGNWRKDGEVSRLNNTYCLAASIEQCSGDYNFELAINRIKQHLGLKKMSEVLNWNDEPERTFEEVQAVLKACDL